MAKGVKTGGRQKGTPNRSTADVREVISRVISGTAPQLMAWIQDIEDPAKRVDACIKVYEFGLPKLARTEVAASDAEGNVLNLIGVAFVAPLK